MAVVQVSLSEEEEYVIALFALANYCHSKPETIKKIIMFFAQNYIDDLLIEVKKRGIYNGNTRPRTANE